MMTSRLYSIDTIPGLTPDAKRILEAVALQADMFEDRYFEPTLDGRIDTLRRAEKEVALQIWEAAFAAAEGKVE